MNLTLIQNHGLKYVNKIDVLRGDDMNEFSDFELQLLSEILDTLIVFDDNSYCPVDNLEGIKEKIDFELTIRGY